MRITPYVIAFLLLSLNCSQSKHSADPVPAVPVIPVRVAETLQQDMPIAVETVGTVEPYNSVAIIPQISGQIQKIHFKEGQYVESGALLFSIDPAPFEEKLRLSKARRARDRATLEFRRAEADRYAFLVERGAVSQSEYEKNRTDAAVLEEMIKEDEAAVEQAKLILAYCYIRSPIEGKIGVYLVNIGAITERNITKLAIINQISPIYVVFSVPEQYLPDIKKYRKKGTLKVTVRPPENKTLARIGTLTFIDNAIDTESGMIRLKAKFPNRDRFFWPGQFVQVNLTFSLQQNAIVIPVHAVQAGQNDSHVFVVNPDMVVESRVVLVDRKYGEYAVISHGVRPGEKVVIDGQNKLKNGFKVTFKKPQVE